jgi:shikimate kinase
VARLLGRPFVDADEELARRAGRPAGRVLAEEGEAAFRERERRATLAALARRGAVVSLGGGALAWEPSRAEVEAALAGAFVLHLRAAPAAAAARVRGDAAERPALRPGESPEEESARLAREREPLLARLAAAAIDTDGRAVEDVAAEAARRWASSARARVPV